jgi:hypothetical protein
MEVPEQAVDSDLQLIAALLQTSTVREAASKAGVSEATVYRRLRQPAFRRRLKEARLLVFAQALSRLQSATGDAVDTLLDVMADHGAPPASRVRAACAVLDLASREMGPESLQDLLDADARREAVDRGDMTAYLEAGGGEADWRLQQLIASMSRPYESP